MDNEKIEEKETLDLTEVQEVSEEENTDEIISDSNENSDETKSDCEDNSSEMTDEISNENVEEEKDEEETSSKTSKADWVHVFVLAFLFVFIIINIFFRLARVDGSSMYPTLKEGQPLVISNLFYTPKTGDIVVLQQGNLETRFLTYPIVKRVIATGGQTVEINFKNWTVKVDGVLLDESYINKTSGTMARLDTEEDTFTVPEGYVFVMGDNRNGSMDSRDSRIGFLREDEILGKVIFRILPFTIF